MTATESQKVCIYFCSVGILSVKYLTALRVLMIPFVSGSPIPYNNLKTWKPLFLKSHI